METKHVIIVIFAFFVGGVLGFVLNGQINSCRMQRVGIHNSDFGPGRPCCKNDDFRNHKKQHGAKVLQRATAELQLDESQQAKIKTIIDAHLEKVDLSRPNPANFIAVIDEVKAELSDSQKVKLDSLLAVYRPFVPKKE
ncbi:MAG: hypothetical protein IPO21_00675 [Bacteroidales bacterium]|nr:hypothetical protein [Bacteroidales bacterium]